MRSSNSEDYLLRLITEAAGALRVLRYRLMGTADLPETVREQANSAIRALQGERAAILERIDADSAVRMVGDYDHIAVWASLLEVECDAAQRAGDVSSARRLRERALDLRRANEVAHP